MRKLSILCGLLLPLLFSCREAYIPPNSSTAGSYLVVEGVINAGGDSTTIKLSKTVSLTSKTTVNPVAGATVMVENNQNGTTWALAGDGHGNYAAAALNLSAAAQYRLSIVTSDGAYVSDFVPVTATPPIDSVGYRIESDGVHLYVSTHDPSNNARLYRWDFQETWIFHSEYDSGYIADTVNDMIVQRTAGQSIYYCFGTDASSDILMASTKHLSKSAIYQQPLTTIPFTSEKVENKYSILVKQYALTDDAYTYYENLRKNTEQLGTIFSTLPTELIGNIHSTTNNSVPAVGYVSATNVQTKRIFIPNDVLPAVLVNYPYTCEVDTATIYEVANTFFYPPFNAVPIDRVPKGYVYSTIPCVDCTVRGTTKTPSFWK